MSVNKQQHLDFIQNTITKLNENSFKIKELSVLLTTRSQN
jgi:tryptophanase